MISKLKKLLDESFLKFLIVGGEGFILNLVIFFILADILGLDPNLVALIAFVICITHNYLLNHIWSFKGMVDSRPNLRLYLKYFFVSCCALVVNLLVLNFVLIVFKPDLKVIADFFALLSSFIINFLGSRFFVFTQKSPKISETQTV